MASLVALAGFAGAGIWLARTPYPFAGEPIVVADIPPAEELKTASIDKPEGEEASDPVLSAEETPVPTESEAIADTAEPAPAQLQQDTYRTEAAIFVSPRRALKPAPIAAIMEVGTMGQLPRIGPGGKKAMDLYARTTPRGVVDSDMPKIAILLGGMGLNPKLTKQAIADLPGDITFAFAPYGTDLQTQVDKARKDGHEVMLQLPMEPVGYPATNPGPRTLLSDAEAPANLEALLWHMSRFTGYTGVTNYMGGKFLAEAQSLRPVATELKSRGLLFLEDSTVPLTVTAETAKSAGLPLRKSQIVIDADPNPASIRAALDLLEGEARSNGFAIGTGSGLSITIETVAEWSKQLQERGILLVPVSAAYKARRT
ncbi:MAG: divergent polysaccharide deacetylase family protein [Aestuariivirga sp.]